MTQNCYAKKTLQADLHERNLLHLAIPSIDTNTLDVENYEILISKSAPFKNPCIILFHLVV